MLNVLRQNLDTWGIQKTDGDDRYLAEQFGYFDAPDNSPQAMLSGSEDEKSAISARHVAASSINDRKLAYLGYYDVSPSQNTDDEIAAQHGYDNKTGSVVDAAPVFGYDEYADQACDAKVANDYSNREDSSCNDAALAAEHGYDD